MRDIQEELHEFPRFKKLAPEYGMRATMFGRAPGAPGFGRGGA